MKPKSCKILHAYHLKNIKNLHTNIVYLWDRIMDGKKPFKNGLLALYGRTLKEKKNKFT